MISGEIDLQDKILWVCRENIGRSQVAQTLWNAQGFGIESHSAGIIVDEPGGVVGDKPEAKILIDVMKDIYRLDISNNVRTDVASLETELKCARLVVVLAEPEVVPVALVQLDNVHTWSVHDLKDIDRNKTIEIVRGIKSGFDSVLDVLASS